jgi:hypothetical protein
MARQQKMELHSFYCMNCGKKALELMRKCGKQHGDFHRKKLYCPWCKVESNCIECRTPFDVEEFQANFAEGLYKEENEQSIEYVRANALVWE